MLGVSLCSGVGAEGPRALHTELMPDPELPLQPHLAPCRVQLEMDLHGGCVTLVGPQSLSRKDQRREHRVQTTLAQLGFNNRNFRCVGTQESSASGLFLPCLQPSPVRP